MPTSVLIGLVGDHDESVPAHRAIPIALRLAADASEIRTDYRWIPTSEVASSARLTEFDGLWCVPASPYRSMDGALLAIRHAREGGLPFLGTCGGFQHAIVEYARNVLGWVDADHAETSPNSTRAVIAPLDCALIEVSGLVRFLPGSRIASAYGRAEATEAYHCRYGLNPDFAVHLTAGPLRAVAHDTAGEVRAVELEGHSFFVATLFQPERRAASKGEPAPLVCAFLKACAARDPAAR